MLKQVLSVRFFIHCLMLPLIYSTAISIAKLQIFDELVGYVRFRYASVHKVQHAPFTKWPLVLIMWTGDGVKIVNRNPPSLVKNPPVPLFFQGGGVSPRQNEILEQTLHLFYMSSKFYLRAHKEHISFCVDLWKNSFKKLHQIFFQ